MEAATECPTCLGHSRGGRIRVTNLWSIDLLMGAQKMRQHWLTLRRMAIDTGAVESAQISDGHVKAIDLTIEELKRTRAEMGWA